VLHIRLHQDERVRITTPTGEEVVMTTDRLVRLEFEAPRSVRIRREKEGDDGNGMGREDRAGGQGDPQRGAGHA
jgi:hypothetical protein